VKTSLFMELRERRCNRPEYTPGRIFRPIHTPSGQIIHPWYQSRYQQCWAVYSRII